MDARRQDRSFDSAAVNRLLPGFQRHGLHRGEAITTKPMLPHALDCGSVKRWRAVPVAIGTPQRRLPEQTAGQLP